MMTITTQSTNEPIITNPVYIHLRDHTNAMNAAEFEELFKVEAAQWEAHPEKKETANTKQVGGDHYKKMNVQPWDVIDAFPHAQSIGFYKGNAIKYIMRAGEKGPAKEDYEKALHYLEKLIESLD